MNKNEIYKKLFDDAKYNYLLKNNATIEQVDFVYNKASHEEINKINFYNNIVIKELKDLNEEGLCIPLSICLLSVSAFFMKQQYAFLTYGRIVRTYDSFDMFDVKSQKEFLEKYSEKKEQMKNIHAWITLSGGTIIDPSINYSKKESNILIGSPEDLQKEYEYYPYMVREIIELEEFTEFDENYFNKRIISIKNNYRK